MSANKETYALSFLVRFGAKQHIEDLVHKGILYANPITSFREERANDPEGRSDNAEGASYFASRSEDVQLTINGKPICGAKNVVIDDGDPLASHIVSFTGLWEGLKIDEGLFFDPRMLEWGNSFFLCGYTLEFLHRIENAAAHVVDDILHGPMTYRDFNSHNDHVGPFVKSDAYSWQREWRLAFSAPAHAGQSLILEVGDLSDIAHSYSVTDIKENSIVFNEENIPTIRL